MICFSRLTAGVILGALAISSVASVTSAQNSYGMNMIGAQSQNEGMLAVPKPGEVKVDGKLDDWDWSGRIWSFADKSVRNTYSAETAAMWDKDAVYVAIKWKDATPMYSMVDPKFNVNEGWKSDAIQLRIATADQNTWITTWYFTPRKQAVLQRSVWKDLKNAKAGQDATVYTAENDNPDLGDGVQMAYHKNDAGDGYNQEIRIPWKLIYAKQPDVKAGMAFKMGMEFIWGDSTGKTWPAHRYADNLQPGKTSREFFWTAVDDWGNVQLTDKNNVEVRQYIEAGSKLTGRIPFRFELPLDAKAISIAIDDANGKRVRNIGGLDVADYTVAMNDKTRTVEVMWDGVSDPSFEGNKIVSGQLLPVGSYRAKALYHTGLHAKYEMCFYNPGTPPWNTPANTGGWGADHTPPLRVSRAGDGMIVSWQFAEGGAGILGLDAKGQKIWEEKRGGYCLASDDAYVYAVPDSWHIKEEVLIRLDRKTGKYAPFTLEGKERIFELPTAEIFAGKAPGKILSMAAGKDGLVLAMSGGEVVVLDKESAQIKQRLPLPGVGKVTVGDDGKVYALVGAAQQQLETDENAPAEAAAVARSTAVGGKVHLVDLGSGKTTAIETPGVAQAVDLAVDRDGNIVVLDIGPDCQAKAFSPDGKPVYACGQKGGRPIRGKYQPQAMSHMSSVAVDLTGNVWVVESWSFPRRVSIWGRDGKLVKDYMGNTGYAGTGTYLHETDPSLGYVGPMEFKLDKQTRTWQLQQILWVPDAAKGERFEINPGNHSGVMRFESAASGKPHQYLFVAPFRQQQGYTLFIERNGDWKPAACVSTVGFVSGKIDDKGGLVTAMPEGEFKDCDPYDGLYWADANADGIVQRSECTIVPTKTPAKAVGKKGQTGIPIYSGWGCRIREDLSFYAQGITEYKPTGFTQDGIPKYGPAGTRENGVADQADLVPLKQGTELLSLSQKGLRGIDTASGKVLWTYPNLYNSVHGSHKATMPKPGLLIGSLKVSGVADINDEVGQVFQIRGNLGQDYFLTTDGVYIDAMFQDCRLPGLSLPATEEQLVDMPLESFSQGGEPFNGWFGKQADGKIRLTSGLPRQACMVMQITGLENVHRLAVPSVNIDQAMYDKLAADQQERIAAAAKASVREYTITKLAKPANIDGKLDEWKSVPALEAARDGSSEKASIKLAYDSQNLYALFDVKDASPWKNEGRDFARLFKTGDTVDLQLSATGNKDRSPKAGDVRVLIGQLNGKPKAVVMKPVAPGAPAGEKHTYVSPVQPRTFDQVAILDATKVVAKPGDGRYLVEAAIPWSALGIEPKPGATLSGDFGITGSDVDGKITTSRIYWSNVNTNLVNDEPAESWLTPNEWGTVKLAE